MSCDVSLDQNIERNNNDDDQNKQKYLDVLSLHSIPFARITIWVAGELLASPVNLKVRKYFTGIEAAA